MTIKSFDPSSINLPLPISTGERSFSTITLGPDPLGYLIDAGPLCKKPVVKSFLVSFSSDGVITIILGMHLK